MARRRIGLAHASAVPQRGFIEDKSDMVVSRTRHMGVVLLTALALVVPFDLLEAINAPASDDGFPARLFGFMFVHALLIAAAQTPAVTRWRSASSLRGLEWRHWAGIVAGAALLAIYAHVLVDQLPCFLGVPNCD
jgi:hypothetical protein